MVASPFLLVSFAAMLLLGGLAQPDAPGSLCPPQVEVAPEEAEQARAVVDEFVAAASTATAPGADATAVATAEATLDRLTPPYVFPPPGGTAYIEVLSYLGLPLPTDADVPLSAGESLELYQPADAPIILLTVEVSNGQETRTLQFTLVNENGEWRIESVAPVALDPAGCYLIAIEPASVRDGPVVGEPPVVVEPPVGIEPPVAVGSPPIVVVDPVEVACPGGAPPPGSSGEMQPVVTTIEEAISPDQMGPPAIHVVNADGSGRTTLAPNGYTPTWSPDGVKIAFVSPGEDRFGAGNNMAVINDDGSGQSNLTSSQDFVWDASPVWSPDGTRIAFIRNSGDSSTELYVMNADGSEPTRLGDAGGIGPPAWSPDSTRIAVAGPSERGSNVWAFNADGSGREQLTDLTGEILSTTWSPDGSRIAFAATVLENSGAYFNSLYVMNSDGTELEALTSWDPLSALCVPEEAEPTASPTPGSTGIFSAPTWSPDSTQLAFATESGLATINADGSDLTVLPVDGLNVQGPVWSPDGAWIAFIGSAGAAPGIYVVHPDGSELSRVAEQAGFDAAIAWAPDGSKIAFVVN